MAHIRDTKWLTLEVCREFQRGTCSRSDQECKFAHPAKSCQVDNGRVIACFDSLKVRKERQRTELRSQIRGWAANLVWGNKCSYELHHAQNAPSGQDMCSLFDPTYFWSGDCIMWTRAQKRGRRAREFQLFRFRKQKSGCLWHCTVEFF